jgi:hypothetical protein
LALKLLKEKFSARKIAELTELNLEEIKELKEQY